MFPNQLYELADCFRFHAVSQRNRFQFAGVYLLWHPARMKKPRKAKKRPAKKRKTSIDVNQMAANLVKRTIKESGG
jgi:hypothetical protein